MKPAMVAWQEDILRSIGVQSLSARFSFPFAKAEAVLPEAQELDRPDASAPIQTESHAENKTDLFLVLSEDKSKTEPLSAGETISEPVYFQQTVIKIGGFLFLLEEPSPHYVKFLQDIVLALAGKADDSFLQHEFHWPPSKDLPIANHWQTAQQTFLAFLQSMCQPNQSNQPIKVFSFGTAASYLIEPSLALGQSAELANFTLLQLQPLQSYLQSGEAKKILWQQLQTIR